MYIDLPEVSARTWPRRRPIQPAIAILLFMVVADEEEAVVIQVHMVGVAGAETVREGTEWRARFLTITM